MHTNSQSFRNLMANNDRAPTSMISTSPAPRPVAAPRESPVQKAPTAQIATADAPPISQPRKERRRTGGRHHPDDVARRRAFVRDYLVEHPLAKVVEIIDACRDVFGFGIASESIAEIKLEIQSETKPARVAGAKRTKSTNTIDVAINAAVLALIEAVPDLRELLVTVDEDGAASVNYSVREVRVVSGEIRVRR